MPSIRPLRPLATLAAAAGVAFLAAPAAAQACPGAHPGCPYFAASQTGESANGVLRFPQTVSVAPDGTVYVGDQHSRVVQAFSPDGRYLRSLGRPGKRPGELSSVGAVATAPDGSVYVGDGSNRIDHFAPGGRLLHSWGRSGTAVGRFRFGAGGGNDAGAGGALAVSDSHVYVVDSGNDRVQRFARDGSKGMELIQPGTLAYPKGIAVRKTRLVVADNQNHRVRAYDTGGRHLTTIGRGEGDGPGEMEHPYGVALDTAGRLFVADNMNHRVQRFSTQPDYKYVGRWGGFGRDAGRMAYVRGIAVDRSGNVYVANTGNDRIDVFDRGGRLLRSFGRSGRSQGQFNTPAGVAADGQGYRAVADSINGRIEFLDPTGKVVTSWGSPNPGPTILPRPVDVAFDSTGDAYVLDQRRARIVVFDRETGTPVRDIASQGSGPGKLRDPSALAIDNRGVITVADTGNHRIARFSLAGDYLGATGTGKPTGVAVTPDGSRTYVSDTDDRITVYDAGGGELAIFGGTGQKLGKLNVPAQMTLDANGNLWVADRGNNRIQLFGPAGERLLTFGERGSAPGQFVNPTDVSIDCRGLLTVTDTQNNRVQQFALSPGIVPPTPCRALAPLGTPPAPKLPTLPPAPGPEVEVKVLRTSKLLSTRNVPLRVRCDTVCSLDITGTISERGSSEKKTSVKVRFTTTRLDAGQRRIVRPSITKKQASRLRKALGKRRGLEVTLHLSATSDAEETTEETVAREGLK